jgi:hypothetical protein
MRLVRDLKVVLKDAKDAKDADTKKIKDLLNKNN